MKVTVRFIGIPGINVNSKKIFADDTPRVKELLEKVCEMFPEIFPSVDHIVDRFLVLIEDKQGKTTNIRLKDGLRTVINKGESLIVMPPLTGG
jgi:molybdopterin converting factor small subunit